MKLIIGGAYQGKLTWAVEQFGLAPDTLCDLAQGFQPGKRCYYHLEAFTRGGIGSAGAVSRRRSHHLARGRLRRCADGRGGARVARTARCAAPAAVPPERDRYPYFLRLAAASETMILRDFP